MMNSYELFLFCLEPKHYYLDIYSVLIYDDRNPHLENLMDSRRCVYIPQSEEANMVVDLPNMSGYPNMVKIIQYLLKTLRPSYLLSSS